ncbi:9885_t:CDS:2, partial [Ambispora leptoticha]
MNNFEQHLRNNREHDRHHYLFGKTPQAIDYLTRYYRDDSCSVCYPPPDLSHQFYNFWAWFSTFQPAISFSRRSVRRFEKFNVFDIGNLPDRLLSSFIFSFRYSEQPDDFPTFLNEFLTAYQETNRFNTDPFYETYDASETLEGDLMAQNNNRFDAPLLIDPDGNGNEHQDDQCGDQANLNPQIDPMALLAHQIGNLVLQMQNNPAPQINIPAINLPAQHRELNLVSYPDFSGGEQDPITWLEDVEKAFEANQVQDNRKIPVVIPHLKGTAATWWVAAKTIRPPIDRWNDPHHAGQSFRPHFIAQFRTPALESKWFAQLTQRKQGPTEDVDSYHMAIEELIRRVEAGGHRYPGTAKAQMFINGLRPELSTAVAPFMPNTLSAAYERAKAFENSFKQNPLYYNPYLTTSLHPSPYLVSHPAVSTSPSPNSISVNPSVPTPSTISSPISHSTKTEDVLDTKEPPRRNFNSWNNTPRYPCGRCGQVGHNARTCPNPLPSNNDGNVATGSNAIPLGRPNAARTNPPVNNNSDTPNRVGGSEAQTFLNLHVDEDDLLFLPAEESARTVRSTRAKRQRVEDSTLGELLEEERAGDQEEISEVEREAKRKVATASKHKKEVKAAPVKKKKAEENPPQISALIPRYSIISDIRDKPANIMFGQLLQVVSSYQVDLAKSLRKTNAPKRRTRVMVNLQPSPRSTALYCDARIHDKIIPLIVDSGSSESVVSSYLLGELGIKVERPSTVNMVNVHGRSKRALGEISDFPFSVRGVIVPVDVVVTDAASYQAIVGNDWLSNVNANINYTSSEMTFHWNDREVVVPVEFRRLQHTPIQDDRPPKIKVQKADDDETEESGTEEESESEFEEEEGLEDRLFGFSEDERTLFQYHRNDDKIADDSDDETVRPQYNVKPEGRGEGDDESPLDFDGDDPEPDHEYYFDEVEESSQDLELDIGDLWDDDHDRMEELLFNNNDLFAWEPHNLGRTSLVTHTINTGDAPPIRQRYY